MSWPPRTGLRQALFGARPYAEVVIGYVGTEPVGFALFFHNFSTFRGAPGLYLEDLFVDPQWRGRGFGRRLLAHLAAIAVSAAATGWNGRCSTGTSRPSLLSRAGARLLDDWRICRLTGDALRALAGEQP